MPRTSGIPTDGSPTTDDFLLGYDPTTGLTDKQSIANILALATLIGGAATADVITQETTAATSAADLATTGPSVTVTIGASGKAIVIIRAMQSNNTVNVSSYSTFIASGANTVAASLANGTRSGMASGVGANSVFTLESMTLLTGLTAGSTTFKQQYYVDGGTGSFLYRRIIVIPL